MDQQNSGQRWQQLQANIEGFLKQTLNNDIQGVEYKPLHIALFTIPSEHRQNEQKAST